MTYIDVHEGPGPIILGQPHCGLLVPAEIEAQLNARGAELLDTDWRVDQLYDGLAPSATVVRTTLHRYVVDCNRDPSGQSLYPGVNTTALVPTTNFDNEPIWKTPLQPAEIDRRRPYHAAYHEAMRKQIERVRAAHGVALVYDCHSIRSRIPHLFDGQLPDLNFGDHDGRACAPAFTQALLDTAARFPNFTFVLNGRFRGGWTTRHYGRPERNVHAVQMEIAQICYLKQEEAPFKYCVSKANLLRKFLREGLARLEELALERA